MKRKTQAVFESIRAPLVVITAAAALVAFLPGAARAGVFNIPHFVSPGEFAVGIEPEITLTNGAGMAGNLKYTQGLNDLMNVQAIVGTGDGPRRFRAGANAVFDFFPDVEGQPGIGLATQGLYYRLPDSGQFELTAIPYIHKNFSQNGGDVEPFFAVPFGMSFNSGRYKAISNVAVGSMFKNIDHFRYSVELGVNVNNAESYISGGITYYH